MQEINSAIEAATLSTMLAVVPAEAVQYDGCEPCALPATVRKAGAFPGLWQCLRLHRCRVRLAAAQRYVGSGSVAASRAPRQQIQSGRLSVQVTAGCAMQAASRALQQQQPRCQVCMQTMLTDACHKLSSSVCS